MNKVQKLLCLFEIPIISIVIVQVWIKTFPVGVYYTASALLGVLISIAILTQHQYRIFTFLQIIILALLVRNIYYIGTQFSVIPYGDGYTEYTLLRTISENANWAVISQGSNPVTTGLSLYSGWPGLGILGTSLSQTLGIDPLYIAIILPQIIIISCFLIGYCLLRKFEDELELSSHVTSIALLVMATSPFLLQLASFYHQDIGTVYLMTFFLLTIKIISKPSPMYNILFLLIILATIITHHYTSFIIVIYLYLLSLLALGEKYLSPKLLSGRWQRAQIPTFFSLSLITSLFILLWWSNFNIAYLLSPQIVPRTENFIEMISTLDFHWAAAADIAPYYVPSVLAPFWVPIAMYSRSVLMYFPALVGFILLFREGKLIPTKVFILLSLLIAAFFLSIDLLFGLRVGILYRGLFLFAPFLAFATGIFYQYTKDHWRRFAAMALVLIFSLFTFASLTGLSGHSYAFIHLYDREVSWVEAGEHSPSWRGLEKLFNEYAAYEDLDQILTDDKGPIRFLIPLNQYEKIQHIECIDATLSGKTLTVIFKDFRRESYISQNQYYKLNLDFNRDKFRQQLEGQCNRIFNSGVFKIWWGAN